jgi:hypothetical protein
MWVEAQVLAQMVETARPAKTLAARWCDERCRSAVHPIARKHNHRTAPAMRPAHIETLAVFRRRRRWRKGGLPVKSLTKGRSEHRQKGVGGLPRPPMGPQTAKWRPSSKCLIYIYIFTLFLLKTAISPSARGSRKLAELKMHSSHDGRVDTTEESWMSERCEELSWVTGVRRPGGWGTIYIDTAAEAASYTADPEAWTAAYFGLTKEEYAEWVDLDGIPLCSCRTAKGTMCRATCGHSQLSADEWKARHRRLPCAVHARIGAPVSALCLTISPQASPPNRP